MSQYLLKDPKDWPLVATIHMARGPRGKLPDKYAKGYGLAFGSNNMWLHADSGKTSAGKDTVFWKARIDTSLFDVIREEHPGYVVPGTARWGWSDGDEQVWVACMVGCCMVKPDDPPQFNVLSAVVRP